MGTVWSTGPGRPSRHSSMDSENQSSGQRGGVVKEQSAGRGAAASDPVPGSKNEIVQAPSSQQVFASPRESSTPEADAERALLGVTKGEYGDDYNKHVVELYKVFVDSADKISARRV